MSSRSLSGRRHCLQDIARGHGSAQLSSGTGKASDRDERKSHGMETQSLTIVVAVRAGWGTSGALADDEPRWSRSATTTMNSTT
jgi:hypothetical protein